MTFVHSVKLVCRHSQSVCYDLNRSHCRIRFHQAWSYGVHVNVSAFKFSCQCITEFHLSRFEDLIGPHIWSSTGRRNKHYHAFISVLHPRQEQLGEEQRSPEVDFVTFIPNFHWNFFYISHGSYCGIVKQNVNYAVVSHYMLVHYTNLPLIRQVNLVKHTSRLRKFAVYKTCCRRSHFIVDFRYDDRSSHICKSPGGLISYSSASACQQHCFSL